MLEKQRIFVLLKGKCDFKKRKIGNTDAINKILKP